MMEKGSGKQKLQLKLTPQETITYRYLPTKMMDVWKMYHFQVKTFFGYLFFKFQGGAGSHQGFVCLFVMLRSEA